MRRFANAVTITVLMFSGLFLLFGALLGWLLLWLNPSWSRREKLIGSLIPVASFLAIQLLFARFDLGLVLGVILTGVMVVFIITDAAWLSSRVTIET